MTADSVSIYPCGSYETHDIENALHGVLAPIGGLGWVRQGMVIAIKVNLVTFMRPETAAVSHPAPVVALCRMLSKRGASVVVGDSPGGPFNASLVNRVYSAAGMKTVEEAGASLNSDYSVSEVEFPGGKALQKFQYTAWLSKADAIINFCKLKTHGLMALSCGVKNIFGAIPGTRKPELHYTFPKIDNFADMLVDLCEYVKPALTIVDAVVGMEGNGPTHGSPREIGALIASKSAYSADLLSDALIGLAPQSVPTIASAISRGLSPVSVRDLEIIGPWLDFAISDFKLQPLRDSTRFEKNRIISTLFSRVFTLFSNVSPEKCVGCRVCADVCPQKTIVIKDRLAVISRKKCISCFCCGEFCPKGAIEMRRTRVAQFLTK